MCNAGHAACGLQHGPTWHALKLKEFSGWCCTLKTDGNGFKYRNNGLPVQEKWWTKSFNYVPRRQSNEVVKGLRGVVCLDGAWPLLVASFTNAFGPVLAARLFQNQFKSLKQRLKSSMECQPNSRIVAAAPCHLPRPQPVSMDNDWRRYVAWKTWGMLTIFLLCFMLRNLIMQQ